MPVDPEAALERLRITANGARRLRMRVTPVVVDELAAVIAIIDQQRAGTAENERIREYRRKRATRRFDSLLEQRRELAAKLDASRELVDEILVHFTHFSSSWGPCVRTGLLDVAVVDKWRKRAAETAFTRTDPDH